MRNSHIFFRFSIPFILTLIFLRLTLFFFPNANVYFLGQNIHHFYTGTFFLLLTLPFLIFNFLPKTKKIALILTGIFVAVILDEFVYLIFTKGTDQSYFTFTSFYGMIFFAIFILIYYLLLSKFSS